MQAPLLWQKTPYAGNYINSVATCGNGFKVVAGTFLFKYSSDARRAPSAPQSSPQPNPNMGTFGTYCWDSNGNLLWSNTFDGCEGVYWVAISGDGSYAASGGLYDSSSDGFIAAFNAQTGAVALDYYRVPHRVNQIALSANGSILVACSSNQMYIFTRTGTIFSTPPITFAAGSDDTVVSIGISDDGQWIAGGTYEGNTILLAFNGTQITNHTTWTPPSENTVHRLAMAAQGQGFAIAMTNGEFAYFDCNAMNSGATQPNWSQTLAGTDSVYGVGIAADASFVSATGNVGKTAGVVGVYDNNGSTARLRWTQNLQANPNSSSIDSLGLFVAVADGHPDGTPGHFSLFKADSGYTLWSCTAGNMSWPIQISSNAMMCVAGSDDGNVYYFAPLRVLD
jgi:WD40 repeat protein